MYTNNLFTKFFKKFVIIVLMLLLLKTLYHYLHSNAPSSTNVLLKNRTIIVITPTYARPERLAELTRLSQTLMHIEKLIWIVVEDSKNIVSPVKRLLERSGVDYVYLYAASVPGNMKGRIHRNLALDYVKKNYRHYGNKAVVYFADDDNTYDIRLYNDYIRNVDTIGVWAVGLVGGSAVDAPHVENGVITKWDVAWKPDTNFAIDMAGFAINLEWILNSNVSFLTYENCHEGYVESCFLSQFGIDKKDVKPFGWDDDPKEVLVWHTKTWYYKIKGGHNNYTFEDLPNQANEKEVKSLFSSWWTYLQF